MNVIMNPMHREPRIVRPVDDAVGDAPSFPMPRLCFAGPDIVGIISEGRAVKISIITAVYNAEPTVAHAIQSVARQTYHDVEHLIVEGQSTDASLAVIQKAAHDRMTVHSGIDAGIYDALNKGIALTTGAVVGVVHADDYLAGDGVLDRIAAAFADPGVEAVFGDLDYVAPDDTGRVIRHWRAGAYHPRLLQRGWMPPHPTLYLRRSVFDRIGVYDTAFRISADYDFVLRYFSQTAAAPVYIDDVLVKMRVGGASNRSLRNLFRKSREDYAALRRNNVGGLGALVQKNMCKLPQFITRRATSV